MNVYYDPEESGLEIVLTVQRNLGYEFDMFVVWTDGERFYAASDSGCSCPIPFEDLGMDDLREHPRSPYELHGMLDEWAKRSCYCLDWPSVADAHLRISGLS